MGKKLTDRQEKFCNEYLVDLNATQAAIRAGYSKKTAQVIAAENLSKPIIQEKLQKCIKKQQERTQITADKVLADIEEVKERCMQKVPVLDEEGNPTGEWRFEATPALRALELLGKHLALFTDRQEHLLRGAVQIIDDV